VYVTRRGDVKTYAHEIGFGNVKHLRRAEAFGVL